MVDLISLIPYKEKQDMENYICKTNPALINIPFVGLDTFLENWNKSNQKLFHLLDDNLIYKEDFCLEKDKEEIKRDIQSLMNKIFEEGEFDCHFIKLYDEAIRGLLIKEIITKPMYEVLIHLTSSNCIAENKAIPKALKEMKTLSLDRYKYETADFKPKRDLKIAYEMSLMKALKKVIDFFNLGLDKEFEQFRIEVSQIFNDRYIKGTICYSIHPYDFITMSDNDYGWTSCMNWTSDSNGGCYHAGTIEMMNSNNVICCYICSDDKLFKYKGSTWNSKKWRQLMYITPEIICGGWAYPYQNDKITTIILETLRKLAKKNLNWTYQFGPEYYNDMVNIFSLSAMDNNRYWIKNNLTQKHNILFDTKLMYNDFLNKNRNNTKVFLCIRNKVKKNTIISVSGKCNCLSCNTDLQEEYFNTRNNWDYNERYTAADMLLCGKCSNESKCYICNSYTNFKLLTLKDGKRICEKCYDDLRLCPCCGKRMQLKINPLIRVKGLDPIPNTDKMYITLKDILNNYRFVEGSLYCNTYKCFKTAENEAIKDADGGIINYEKYKTNLLNMLKSESVKADETYGLGEIFMCDDCFYKAKKKGALRSHQIKKPDNIKQPWFFYSNLTYFEAVGDYINGIKYHNYLYENLKHLPLQD